MIQASIQLFNSPVSKMRILFFASLFLLNLSSFAQEYMLNNSQFDAGTNDWILGKYNGASAIFSVENNDLLSGPHSARLEISDGGTDLSDVQFFQNIELESNASYAISFMAQTSAAKKINLSIENDFEILWENELTINETHNIYGPFIFTNENFEPGAAFVLNIGGNNKDLILDSVTINETIPTAVTDDMLTISEIEIFPNPARGTFQLLFDKPITDKCSLLISDISGKEIFKTTLDINTQEKYFNVSDLNMTPGIYLIQARINDFTASEKLIVY